MFNRKIFAIIALSILHDNPDGLTAYQIMKLIKEKFNLLWNPSAGAIYPLLKKLVVTGAISEEPFEDTFRYKITDNGLKFLENIIPETLNLSLDSIPLIFDMLAKAIPDTFPMHFARSMPKMFHRSIGSCPCNNDKSHERFDNFPPKLRTQKLEAYKTELLATKEEIQKWMEEQISGIDEEIRWIEERMSETQTEKEKWVKIPIESDEDSKKEKTNE
jgi:DNA-binding PadR family transcriptional regulator